MIFSTYRRVWVLFALESLSFYVSILTFLQVLRLCVHVLFFTRLGSADPIPVSHAGC